MTPEFAKDFIAFQKSLKPLKRNVTGDDGKPYADLVSIIAYARPKLARHNMAFTQTEDECEISTMLIHVTGHAVTALSKPVKGDDGQIRYGRRHALMCLLGLVEEPIGPYQNEPDRQIFECVDNMREPMRSRVIDALMPLSTAQKLVIIRRTMIPADIIAEAQRLGGAK